MSRPSIPAPIVALVATLVAGLLGPLALVAAPAQAATSTTDVKVRALYYQRKNNVTQRDAMVASITAASGLQGALWTEFFTKWDAANANADIHTSLAGDLPTSGHVFVVLGSALKASGAISTKLERRMQLTLKALAAYPNSAVLVSGGAPRNGHTEAAVMRTWLLGKGIADSRILVEAKSSSTVGNAKYSIDLLATRPEFTSYTLISDASHIRRASVLFDAAEVVTQTRTGAEFALQGVSNYAYPDKAITAKASAATHSVISSNVASVFGWVSAYNKLLSDGLTAAKLTSISLTPPSRLSYAVGQGLDASGLKVTANYNISGLTRDVTALAKTTGFSSTKTGTSKVTVSYTENGVTKTATFSAKVAKAATSIQLTPSTTTLKAKKTKASVRVLVASTGVTATGKVKVYLDKKLLKKATLKAGAVKVTLPKITKVGKHTITAKYAGNDRVLTSTASVKVKVTK